MCLQRTNSSSFHWSIAHTNWSSNHFCCCCWMHIWLFLLLLCWLCFPSLPCRVHLMPNTHSSTWVYVTRQQKQNVDNLVLSTTQQKKQQPDSALLVSTTRYCKIRPLRALTSHTQDGRNSKSCPRDVHIVASLRTPRCPEGSTQPTGFDAFGSDQVLVLTTIFARRTSSLGSRFGSITRVRESTYTRAIPARIANFFGFFEPSPLHNLENVSAFLNVELSEHTTSPPPVACWLRAFSLVSSSPSTAFPVIPRTYIHR